jgi:hypothetical protein
MYKKSYTKETRIPVDILINILYNEILYFNQEETDEKEIYFWLTGLHGTF